MRIGVDLDNTLICYDSLFHKLAVDFDKDAHDLPQNKKAIRDYIRQKHGDYAWQNMQALAYGPHIARAEFFPHALEILANLHSMGHELFIVSHKTPVSGTGGYDLHKFSRDFLEQSELIKNNIINPKNIFFCPTRKEKADKISSLDLQVFIDDLEEVFNDPAFPRNTRKVLITHTHKKY